MSDGSDVAVSSTESGSEPTQELSTEKLEEWRLEESREFVSRFSGRIDAIMALGIKGPSAVVHAVRALSTQGDRDLLRAIAVGSKLDPKELPPGRMGPISPYLAIEKLARNLLITTAAAAPSDVSQMSAPHFWVSI
jgi:hypothetical protein